MDDPMHKTGAYKIYEYKKLMFEKIELLLLSWLGFSYC